MRGIKLIILAEKDIWKHKWEYALLIFELVLVAILLLSFGSKLQGVYESSELCNAFNDQKMYYYTKYQYTKGSLEDYLSKDVFEKIETVKMPFMELKDTENNKYAACGYMDLLMGVCNYQVKEGKWFSGYNGTKIPAVSTDRNIPVGKCIEIQSDGESCQIEVIGQIDQRSYVLNFHGGSSNNGSRLSEFVSHPDSSLIVPYESEKLNCIPENLTDNLQFCNQEMIFVEDESVTKKFFDECSDFGAITDVKTMRSNYYTDIKNDFIVNGTVLFVFAFLSITGLIGFNGIQCAKNEKNYLIYIFSGGKNRDFVIIEVLKNLTVILLSFIIFMLLYRKMHIFDYSVNELNRISWQMILIVFIALSVICVTTSLWYIKKIAYADWLNDYKFKG